MTKRKSIMLSPEDYEKYQEFANDGNFSPAFISKSILNAAINSVAHAKKEGVVPEKVKRINPAAIDKKGSESVNFSDYLLFCALHYREVGKITEEQFQKNIDNLPFFVFAAGMEKIELDNTLTSDLTDKEREIQTLESKLWLLKAENKIEKALKDK